MRFAHLIGWCILVLLLIAMIQLSSWGIPVEVWDFNDLSIVKVMCVDSRGSGFIVGPNQVITAGHVAEDAPSEIVMGNGDRYLVVGVRNDPNSDVALLIVDASFPDALQLTFDSRPLRVGDAVRHVGYLLNFTLMTRECRICAIDCICPLGDGNNLDAIDRVIGPGPSGSPIVRNGKVVGVYVSYNPMGGISLCVPPGEFIHDLSLDK